MLTLEDIVVALLILWTIVGLVVLWRVTNSKGSVTWSSQTTAPEPDAQSITFTKDEIREALSAYAGSRIEKGEKL